MFKAGLIWLMLVTHPTSYGGPAIAIPVDPSKDPDCVRAFGIARKTVDYKMALCVKSTEGLALLLERDLDTIDTDLLRGLVALD